MGDMSATETRPGVTVIAEYLAHPGKGDEVARILPRHIAATREEPGCVTFVAYRDRENPDHFTLYEQYVDDPALEAHRQSPHFKANVTGAIVPLLEVRRAYRYLEIPAEGSD
jgi:autoinducer 2-degrading protein